mmetsp:Transcript_27649/g.40838  ORF Transcript_27649/g.40838 Transcript_27649/m.40838 type:complete len:438 (+) Transcript_27649:215-1528(+)
MVSLTTTDGYLHILNAENGKEIAVHEPFAGVEERCQSKAVLYEEDGKTKYGVYSLDDGRVFAVNPDGKERWLAYFKSLIPNQPTIGRSGKNVYVTLSSKSDDKSQISIVDDEKSLEYGIGEVGGPISYDGHKFGSAAMIQRQDSTSLVFGSYASGKSSFGSTFEYNTNDGEVTELADIGRNVVAPPVLNKNGDKLWLTTSNPENGNAEIFGWVEGSFSKSSFWYTDLGEYGKDVHYAPLLSNDETSLYVTSDRAVYRVDADTGAIIWKVDDLNICSQPILSPNNEYLFVIEETGGRISKISTQTGVISMEHNCSGSECQMISSADIAIGPDGKSIYFAFESGLVMAVEVTDAETMTPSQETSLTPSASPTLSPVLSAAPSAAPSVGGDGRQSDSNEPDDTEDDPVNSKRSSSASSICIKRVEVVLVLSVVVSYMMGF